MRKRLLSTIPILLLALWVTTAPAAALRLDRSFGDGGTVEARFGPTYWESAFRSLRLQPDGSLLAGRGDPRESNATVRRYTASGALDTSFVPQVETREAEAVDSEGKVLKPAAGGLQRLEPDGQPDPTFGTRPFGAAKVSDEVPFKIEAIEPLPDGQILAAGPLIAYIAESGGTLNLGLEIARFDHEGRLDPGFGSGGIVSPSSMETHLQRLLGIFPREGGGVGVIGLENPPGPYGEATVHPGSTIIALNSQGGLDPGFGSGGKVNTKDSIEAFHQLEGGGLLVAGERWDGSFPHRDTRRSDVFVARYTASGAPDPAYGGGDGLTTTDVGDLDLLSAALWEADGTVTIGGASTDLGSANCLRFGGWCPETPYLVRFTPAGAPDPGFGDGGIVRLRQLSYPYGRFEGGTGVLALAARPGGGIFAGGGSGAVAFIAALSAQGGLAPDFGSGGIVTESDPDESTAAGHATAVDAQGRILVVGGTNAGVRKWSPDAGVFRFLPNGTLDQGFGENGFARLPGYGSGIALGGGNAYVLSGDGSPMVSEVGPTGQPVRSFGEEGTVQLPSLVIHWRGRRERLSVGLRGIAVLPGGRVLVAANARRTQSRVVLFRLRADGSLDPRFGHGGVVVRGFGASRRCAVAQMALQRDGGIVLAGTVEPPPNKPRSETFAVMRLRPDGSKDPTFGRKGLVVRRLGHRSYASALALQGKGRVLVAGRAHSGSKVREVLLRLRPDGSLDRSFGRGGVSAQKVPLKPAGYSNRPQQILVTRGHVVVLRDNRYRPLLTYSRDGRHRRALRVARGTEESRASRAPFATLQHGRLLLGWEVFGSEVNAFKLQRLLGA
jgi:uncharacterized delta-60 repeat protein